MNNEHTESAKVERLPIDHLDQNPMFSDNRHNIPRASAIDAARLPFQGEWMLDHSIISLFLFRPSNQLDTLLVPIVIQPCPYPVKARISPLPLLTHKHHSLGEGNQNNPPFPFIYSFPSPHVTSHTSWLSS